MITDDLRTDSGVQISIVMATYNSAATLRRSLDSILSQSVPVELLIADGGSTDGTLDILAEYRDSIAWCKSERDSGVYDAWNKALDHATGTWIVFLGSDDQFDSTESLRRALEFAGTVEPDVFIIYGTVKVVDEHGCTIQTDNKEFADIRSELLRRMPFTHVGTLHRAALFSRYGRFDASFRVAGDYDLMMRSLQDSNARYCRQYGVRMATGGLSTSRTGRLLLLNEQSRIRRKYAIPWSFAVDGYVAIKRLYYKVLSAPK